MDTSSNGPTIRRAFWPLLLLTVVLSSWFAPPDPFTQLLVTLAGLLVAVGLAFWFSHSGSRVLDATIADLWLFVVGTLALVVLGALFIPNPALSALEQGLLLFGAALVSGYLAFSAHAEPLRQAMFSQK